MRKTGQVCAFSFQILSLAILSFWVPGANADAILGTALAAFSVLDASTVTNTGAATLTGNLGHIARSGQRWRVHP
jgi:hypothetical protein